MYHSIQRPVALRDLGVELLELAAGLRELREDGGFLLLWHVGMHVLSLLLGKGGGVYTVSGFHLCQKCVNSTVQSLDPASGLVRGQLLALFGPRHSSLARWSGT